MRHHICGLQTWNGRHARLMPDSVVEYDLKAGSAVKLKLSTIRPEKFGRDGKDDNYGLPGTPLHQRPDFLHKIEVAYFAPSCDCPSGRRAEELSFQFLFTWTIFVRSSTVYFWQYFAVFSGTSNFGLHI